VTGKGKDKCHCDGIDVDAFLSHPVAISPETKKPGTLTSFELFQRLQKLQVRVKQLDIVSSNDTLEDIATKDLKLLLVPHYIATVLVSGSIGNTRNAPSENTSPNQPTLDSAPEVRLGVLRMARDENMDFLKFMRRLDIMSSTDSQTLENIENGKIYNANENRTIKVEQFKREKALAAKIQMIMSKYGDNLNFEDSASGDHEDMYRIAMMDLMNLAILRSFKLFKEIESEIEMVEFTIQQKKQGIDLDAEFRNRQELRATQPVPTIVPGMPANFTILDSSAMMQRLNIQKNVFKPTHELPTYTVEEWGDVQAEMLKESSKVEKATQEKEAKERKEEEENSDRDEVVDKKTYKDREFDLFKDEVNKGSGNSIR